MKSIIKREWAVRIHEKLSGIYGHRAVANKFSHIVEGEDKGTALLIQALQEELGQYSDKPEAIAWAVENLPSDHIPNVKEIKDLCRLAPRAVTAIEYKPEPADPAKVAEITRMATAAISDSRDHMAWAKNPRSQIALDVVVSGSRTDARLKEILNSLVSNGICTDEFKLIPYEKRREAA